MPDTLAIPAQEPINYPKAIGMGFGLAILALLIYALYKSGLLGFLKKWIFLGCYSCDRFDIFTILSHKKIKKSKK